MSYSPSLRKARMAQTVSEIKPLDLRAPLPKEVFEEVRAEIEEVRSASDLSSAGLTTASDGTQASEIRPEFEIPPHWSKGALLNVRNRGDCYVATLYPEEFDSRHPERAMMFPNTWTCQDFVSKWYSRETADPRAR